MVTGLTTARAVILAKWFYYQKPNLDRTFAALSDPTRRALLARLRRKGKTSRCSELARPFPMSLPAIMEHLDVLSGRRARRTREERPHRELPPAGGTHARRQRLAQPLSEILDRAARSAFAAFLERRHMATVTTKPSLTIKRRFNAPPEKVFAAWTDPEK